MGRKSRGKKRALAVVNKPVVPLAEPASKTPYFFYVRTNQGTRVNHCNALFYSAVWCAVRVISDTIASLPWRVMRQEPNGDKEPDDTHVVDWLLRKQPNPEMSATTFKRLMASWVTTWGNAFAEIERDRAGRVVWLWPIAPDRVELGRDETGMLVYKVLNPSSDPTYLPFYNMLHFKGLSHDGLMGYDVIAMAARSIGLGLDIEANARDFWANDSTPSGVLKHKDHLSEEGQELLRKSWEGIHSGKRRIAVLEEDMEFIPIGMANNDSQQVENRKEQILDICRFFKVPPHKLFDLGRATWGNLESQEIEFMVDCIIPWCIEFEQESDLKLFGIQQRGRLFTKFNANARMRGDSQARSNFYKTMANLGAYSPNRILALEDENQIGEPGDKHLVQQALTTLEKIGEEPVEPAQPSVAPSQDDDDEPQDKRIAALMPVIQDTLGRIIRRQEHRLQDISKRLKDDEEQMRTARFEMFAEHRKYMADQLKPLVASMGHLILNQELNGSLDKVIEDYIWWHCGEDMCLDRIYEASAVLVRSVIQATRKGVA